MSTTEQTFRTALEAAARFKNKAVVTAAILDLREQVPMREFAPIPRAATREDLELLYAAACVAFAEEDEIRQAAAEACEIVNGGGGLAIPEAQVEVQGPRPTEDRAVVVGRCPHVRDERGEVRDELAAVVNGCHTPDLGGLLSRARQLLGRTDLVRKVEKIFLAQLDAELARGKVQALRARSRRVTTVDLRAREERRPSGPRSSEVAEALRDLSQRASTSMKLGDLYPSLARRPGRESEL